MDIEWETQWGFENHMGEGPGPWLWGRGGQGVKLAFAPLPVAPSLPHRVALGEHVPTLISTSSSC